ncbi:hypothetical protein Fcan01_17564 [Folsomia candida]|uniref:Uncharacterized protein n=1 Tax=Folsomia candida TaxID=158441 RepID=A0A226DR24_FOLCA|nr:hypothetical protein Fcan01_17564 [Folsomia candida]
MKGQLVPAMIGVVPQIQVFTQFVCIKLYSKIQLPGFIIFPLLLIDSAINNLVIETMAAKVNTNSVKLLSVLNCQLKSLPRRSKCRKELKSCTAKRIQFGQNFVDKGTPLVIENFCIILESESARKVDYQLSHWRLHRATVQPPVVQLAPISAVTPSHSLDVTSLVPQGFTNQPSPDDDDRDDGDDRDDNDADI